MKFSLRALSDAAGTYRSTLVNHGSRTGRALLATEAESRAGHALHRRVKIGVSIDDDRVLAADLQDGALDPDIAGLLRGCALIDVQSNFLRTGKGNVAGLGMLNDRVAKAVAVTGGRSSQRRPAARLLPESRRTSQQSRANRPRASG